MDATTTQACAEGGQLHPEQQFKRVLWIQWNVRECVHLCRIVSLCRKSAHFTALRSEWPHVGMGEWFRHKVNQRGPLGAQTSR